MLKCFAAISTAKIIAGVILATIVVLVAVLTPTLLLSKQAQPAQPTQQTTVNPTPTSNSSSNFSTTTAYPYISTQLSSKAVSLSLLYFTDNRKLPLSYASILSTFNKRVFGKSNETVKGMFSRWSSNSFYFGGINGTSVNLKNWTNLGISSTCGWSSINSRWSRPAGYDIYIAVFNFAPTCIGSPVYFFSNQILFVDYGIFNTSDGQVQLAKALLLTMQPEESSDKMMSFDQSSMSYYETTSLDPFSIVGNQTTGIYNLPIYQRTNLGWYKSATSSNVSASGTYSLAALDSVYSPQLLAYTFLSPLTNANMSYSFELISSACLVIVRLKSGSQTYFIDQSIVSNNSFQDILHGIFVKFSFDPTSNTCQQVTMNVNLSPPINSSMNGVGKWDLSKLDLNYTSNSPQLLINTQGTNKNYLFFLSRYTDPFGPMNSNTALVVRFLDGKCLFGSLLKTYPIGSKVSETTFMHNPVSKINLYFTPNSTESISLNYKWLKPRSLIVYFLYFTDQNLTNLASNEKNAERMQIAFGNNQKEESINNIYNRVSFGQLKFTGMDSDDVDYVNWTLINKPSSEADTVWGSFRNVVKHDHIKYVVANPCSVSGGIGQVPGRETIDDYDSLYDSGRTIPTHELGHNLRLAHANLISCTWIDRTSIVNSCRLTEYGDNSDFMGSGWGTIQNTNMYNRVLLGFYSESLFINASTTVTQNYTLKDTNQFNRTFVTDSLALTFYFPEIFLGTASGGSVTANNSYTNRYIIELWSGSKTGCNVYIRVVFNKSNSWYNSMAYRIGMITLGQSFTDVINNVVFTFVARDAKCLNATILVKP